MLHNELDSRTPVVMITRIVKTSIILMWITFLVSPLGVFAYSLTEQTLYADSITIGGGSDPNFVFQEISIGGGLVEDISIRVSGTYNTSDTFSIICRTSAPTQFDQNGNCTGDNSFQVATTTKVGDLLTGYYDTPVYVNSSSTAKYYIIYFPNSGTRTLYGSSVSTYTGDCVADAASGPNVACSTYGINDIFFIVNGEPSDLDRTQIVRLIPEDNSTVSAFGSVTFELDYFIAPEDIGDYFSVQVYLRNIDQNVLLTGFLSPSDVELLDFVATSTGFFSYSTTTPIGNGNYRIKAQLKKALLGLTLPNVGVYDEVSHQFIVNEGTFIGGVSQTGYDIYNELANSTTSTSTATAQNCYFWYPSLFNIFKCSGFLFIPDNNYLQESVEHAKEGIFTRMPWGYFTRFYVIMSTTTESSLPNIDASVVMGSSEGTTTESFFIDTNDLLAGAGSLLDSIEDPINGMTVREIFEPWIKGMLALLVILYIISDMTGSHKHQQEVQVQQARKT